MAYTILLNELLNGSSGNHPVASARQPQSPAIDMGVAVDDFGLSEASDHSKYGIPGVTI